MKLILTLSMATLLFSSSVYAASSTSLGGTPPTAPLINGNAPMNQPIKGSALQTQKMSNSNPSTAVTSAANPGSSDADWKVPGLPPLYHFGAMTGLGVVDSTGGFTLLGTASMTVLDKGFIPEISNSVAVEIEMGPVFAAGATAFWYSLHMRWDFQKDKDWTFYALGGLAGNDTPSSLGGHYEIWPRIGLGAMYAITPIMSLRAEVSHEFTGIGISFPM